MTPSTQSAFRWRLIPVSLGGILLAAAALKAHALFTDESVVANAFQPGIAAFEFGLGIWLLVGWWSGFARLATLAFFAGAANISLFQFSFGKASCGCFGMLHVAPELVFVLDLVAIVVAALWRPLDSEGTGPSVVKWALVIGVIGAVLVVALFPFPKCLPL